MVACYDVGTPLRPVSSTRVRLAIFRIDRETVGESQPLSFDLSQFDVDHRLMIDDAISPLWETEEQSVIVAHNNGIERIALSGERASLVDGVAVSAIALSPDGQTIVYADARNVYLLDRLHGGQEALLGTNVVPRFGNRKIRAIAYSPYGDRLAFGIGHEVFVLDVDSRTVRRIFEAPHGVYWLGWLSGGKEILLLYGKEAHRSRLHAPWGLDGNGTYALAVIGQGGDLRRVLYSTHLVDVRRATPDLSRDGRYVSFTIANGPAEDIAVAATDGSGIVPITSSGGNAFATWRPVR
jgi:WD40 repeat protein